jgi:hypothetical protein
MGIKGLEGKVEASISARLSPSRLGHGPRASVTKIHDIMLGGNGESLEMLAALVPGFRAERHWAHG